MKSLLMSVSLLALSVLLSGCATSPSIASKGPGSDAAYLNATRGRPDAQISRMQADQYSRQRRQVAEEMELEQQKRQQFYQNAQGTIGIIQVIRSLVPY